MRRNYMIMAEMFLESVSSSISPTVVFFLQINEFCLETLNPVLLYDLYSHAN